MSTNNGTAQRNGLNMGIVESLEDRIERLENTNAHLTIMVVQLTNATTALSQSVADILCTLGVKVD